MAARCAPSPPIFVFPDAQLLVDTFARHPDHFAEIREHALNQKAQMPSAFLHFQLGEEVGAPLLPGGRLRYPTRCEVPKLAEENMRILKATYVVLGVAAA